MRFRQRGPREGTAIAAKSVSSSSQSRWFRQRGPREGTAIESLFLLGCREIEVQTERPERGYCNLPFIIFEAWAMAGSDREARERVLQWRWRHSQHRWR